jgi:3-methyl-2-oxobutanoate hydroxymethyltransferase
MAISVQQIAQWKRGGASARPIAVLTAWDVISAAIVDQAGADMVLVGDSLAMVALGHATTLPLTLEEMLQAARAVRRGVKNALMVVDLPFLSYQVSPEEAIRSAGRVLKETGAQAVKLEGGHGAALETIGRLRQWDIPVMGHVGLTPQSIHQLGGFRQQGQDLRQDRQIGVRLECADHSIKDRLHQFAQRPLLRPGRPYFDADGELRFGRDRREEGLGVAAVARVRIGIGAGSVTGNVTGNGGTP